MEHFTQVKVSIPKSLLAEIDGCVRGSEFNRCQFIQQAMRLYLEDFRKQRRQQMEQGYQQMAPINLYLANETLAAEVNILVNYEEGLVKCDERDCEEG